jgi:hypothetical protein
MRRKGDIEGDCRGRKGAGLGAISEEEGKCGGRVAERGRRQGRGVRCEEEGRYVVMEEGSEKN